MPKTAQISAKMAAKLHSLRQPMLCKYEVTQATKLASYVRMIDKHYAKWIPEDAPPMAKMVNSIMGFEDEFAPETPQKISRTF